MKLSEFEAKPNPQASDQSVTVDGTSKTLAELGLLLDPATEILIISVEANSVRRTISGTPATMTLGRLFGPTDVIIMSRAEAELAEFIATDAPSAPIQVGQYCA
jgi:hypothetical protein